MARVLKLSHRNHQSVTSMIALVIGTSLITALILLVYVMPIYYGVDPLDWWMRLKANDSRPEVVTVNNRALSSTSPTQSVSVNTAVSIDSPATDDPLSVRQDTVELIIPAKQTLDYRLAMERDYDLDYHWTANEKKVDTELHGEAKDGKTQSKTFATLKNSNTGKGFFIIPFNGQFGWHWHNKTDQPVTLRLTTKGHYQVVGQVANPASKQ